MVEKPRIVHAVPGRLRLHLPACKIESQSACEARLRLAPGIRCARLNSRTRNMLVVFDPQATDSDEILAMVCLLMRRDHALSGRTPVIPALPPPRAATPLRPPALRSGRAPGGAERSAVPPYGARGLLGPATWGWVARGIGVAINLLIADSPLGLLAGCVEVCSLLAELGARCGAGHSRAVTATKIPLCGCAEPGRTLCTRPTVLVTFYLGASNHGAGVAHVA